MIVAASTLHPYVMDQPDTWSAWLRTAEAMRETADVQFFAALEVDGRGLEPFGPLVDRLCDVDGRSWSFGFDDGAEEIRTDNRVRRIVLGQYIAGQYALQEQASHLLFLGADTMPPADCIPRLLQLQWPIVGGEVPGYALEGPVVERHPLTGQLYGFPVQEHMATTSFVMIQRELLKRLRPREEVETHLTDDPCLYFDAQALGFTTLVRKDVIGQHYPECLVPIEDRGHDRRIVR